jgi:hypothetical protein
MSRWRTVHASIGVFGVVAFILTGQYMHWFRGQLYGMPDGPRMLYRSAHIYLLSASVANVLLGCYFQPGTDPGVRRLQLFGNVAIAALPMLFATSFFTESESGSLLRPISRLGVYLMAGAAVLHVLSRYIEGRSVEKRTGGPGAEKGQRCAEATTRST